MTEKYDWLEKKTPRSIEQLRLWNENHEWSKEIIVHAYFIQLQSCFTESCS